MKNDDNMRLYRKYAPLSAGSITPKGWLHKWQETNGNGWTLAYAKNRDPGVYSKFWDRNKTWESLYDENDQTLTLCDYTAYFADGLVRYAVLNPGSELEAEWIEWLSKLLASQDADGYIGAFTEAARWRHWLEIFSQTVVIDALLYWYEAWGEQKVLDCCVKAMDCIIRAWKDNKGDFGSHGTCVVRTANKLYETTKNKGYLTFAIEVLDKCGRTEAYMSHGNALHNHHNVMETEHTGLPAMMYEYCGNERYLEASRRAFKMMETYLCVDGQPHGGELMLNTGARINCEHCSAVEFFCVANAMARITGEVKYMDMAERCILNAYPAAKTADGMMLAYCHSPNQLVASEWGVPHNIDIDADWRASRQFFSSAHEPLCCNSCGPRGIPFYIDSMTAKDDNGIAVFYYGPYSANFNMGGKSIGMDMDSCYPYEDEARIRLQMESETDFTLKLRIPEWSSGADVLINGELAQEIAVPGEMLALKRMWKSGDIITLRLLNPIRLRITRKSEFGIRSACCMVYRGALLYTLPVDEDWQFYTAPANGPGTNIISAKAIMKPGAKWNYAVMIDTENPDSCAEFICRSVPEGAKEFDGNSPVAIRVKAKSVENWYPEGDPEHIMTPGAPILPMKLSETAEEIDLIPYGHTCLRMTYLPFIPLP